MIAINEKVEYLMTENRGCYNPFTMKGWIICICVILAIGLGMFVGVSILASYINRQTYSSKNGEKGNICDLKWNHTT